MNLRFPTRLESWMKPQTPPIAPPRKSTLSISTSKGKLDGPPRVELDFSETNAPLEQVIKSLSSTRITKSIDVDVVKSRSIQHVGQLETLSRGKLTSDALNSGDQAGHFDINLNAQAEFADTNANGQEENTDINSTTIQIQVKQAKNISTSQLISMSLSRSEVIQVPAPNTKQDSSSTVVEGPIDFPLDPQTTIDIENPPSSTHLPLKRKQIGKWILGITIGEGSSGKVKLAHHIETKESCVVKAVRRPKLTSFQKSNPAMLAKIYKRELYMIREACLGIILDHTNIVKLHSAVLGENHFYCFFEHIVGIDLVDYISNAGKIDELHARKIFRQVISAVEYAHRNYIVHRDIKLENIRYNPDSGVVKILDFGFASFYAPGQALKTNCGSPCYAAPEIYDNKEYDGALVDVWSLGVVIINKVCLFGMITGCLPFDGDDFKTLALKVRLGNIQFPHHVSSGAMNLLMGMMTVIPKKRYSMETVCNHPWINLGYQTLPVDYLESEYKDKMPSITKEWVNNLQSVSVCQAGCLLMEVLQERIPSKRLEQDIATTDEQGNEILTDEDDINEEEEEEVIDTGSTIKEKPKKWWKKLWTQISTAFIRENPRQRNPTERPNMVQNMRVSINELIPERVVAPYEQKVLEQQIIRNRTQTGELELKSCRSDEAVLNLKMGESSAKKSPVKHKRTNWIPQIMRSRRHN